MSYNRQWNNLSETVSCRASCLGWLLLARLIIVASGALGAGSPAIGVGICDARETGFKLGVLTLDGLSSLHFPLLRHWDRICRESMPLALCVKLSPLSIRVTFMMLLVSTIVSSPL